MKVIYTTLFFFISLVCIGQKQNNNWCFGNYAGVSFNSGSPVSFYGGATSLTYLEGVSAISDTNGNLLFYTDGITVWNKSNLPMPAGSGLFGSNATAEGALIVPQPGNDSIYYVFTLDQLNGPNGLHYSVVDMTLAGGMGDVSQKNIALQKGTLYSEKMIAIFDSSRTNIWVITHKSYSNAFHAYHVTAAGVDTTPVISNVGHTYAKNDAHGTMHCSLDGSRIAAAYWDDLSGYEVFDFDKGSGLLSNPLFLTSANYLWAYSVCFSPDGRYLYGGCYSTSTIYQFDLHQSSPAGALITTASGYVGDMQLGTDSIIYVSLPGNGYLSAIEKPDSAGAACNFVTNDVYLGGTGTCGLGLNNYIYPAPPPVAPPVTDFQSSKTSICAAECISFTDLSANAASWQWYFEGATDSTSASQNPQSVCYVNAGIYNVTLIASNTGGSDSITFINYINVKAAPPAPTITQVHDTLLYCSTDTSYFSYQWYDDTTLIPGATDTVLAVTHGGEYNVQVSNKIGCSIGGGIIIVLNVGIRNYMDDTIFSLYPNPAASQLTIQTPFANRQQATFSIINTLGQVCRQFEIKNPKSEIDISSLPAGMYFLELHPVGWTSNGVKSESGSVVRKFVKE